MGETGAGLAAVLYVSVVVVMSVRLWLHRPWKKNVGGEGTVTESDD